MKKLIALLLCLCFIAALGACSNSGNNGSNQGSTPDTSSQKSNVIDPDEGVYVIKTDYCEMKYPSKWQDKVKVDVTAEKVSFATADGSVKLFDLCFGGDEGYVYGTLNGDKKVELRVVSYDIDDKAANFEEYCAMQEDMNIILQYLIDEGKLTVS